MNEKFDIVYKHSSIQPIFNVCRRGFIHNLKIYLSAVHPNVTIH